MNHSENYKQLETNLINLKAQATEKKRVILEKLEKKEKADEELQSQEGISLSEVAKKITELSVYRDKLYEELLIEVEELESEFTTIKS